MATIYELALMSSDVYNGTQDSNQSTSDLLTGLTGTGREVIATSSALDPLYWAQGYYGVAYYNTVTHEVVFANRGTAWNQGANTLLENLSADRDLAAGVESPDQFDAAAFASQVMANLIADSTPYTSIIETGHSLGGSEAQAAVVSLVNLGYPNSKVSGVLFNSPGIGYQVDSPSSYNVVDFYTQGDAIHAAGGPPLGGANNLIMLAAGPDLNQLIFNAPQATQYDFPEADSAIALSLTEAILGPLKGTLVWISADAEDKSALSRDIDTRTGAMGASQPQGQGSERDTNAGFVYRVHIRTARAQFLVNGQRRSVESGMTVQADILTGRRRVIEFFLSPVIKYLNEGLRVR